MFSVSVLQTRRGVRPTAMPRESNSPRSYQPASAGNAASWISAVNRCTSKALGRRVADESDAIANDCSLVISTAYCRSSRGMSPKSRDHLGRTMCISTTRPFFISTLFFISTIRALMYSSPSLKYACSMRSPDTSGFSLRRGFYCSEDAGAP